jgi:hypothetical protein
LIPVDLVIQGGATALLAAVVWMIVTGRLVPRNALSDAHVERDRWREAALTAMRQNNDLLTGARVTRDVLQALPDPAPTGERA